MSIEAMKQALDAMLNFETVIVNSTSVHKLHGEDVFGNEILALGKAIEQAEQSQWVGLTDEEVRSVYKNVIPDVTVSEAVLSRSIARAIEAKLKEKNT